ncbi:hypothetical protein N7478_000683 [Penicillium angulare]|uniref:uncharacterized protein n=1 Tax=Penicillium angulare TaxID=116970 RepID=UPI00254142BA|nr:uncharacterized protein N7478_000683 [Penicillium angulare]KAJ5291432.1 hypothetical protein N7478_000683 [Penicillium angulare]
MPASQSSDAAIDEPFKKCSINRSNPKEIPLSNDITNSRNGRMNNNDIHSSASKPFASQRIFTQFEFYQSPQGVDIPDSASSLLQNRVGGASLTVNELESENQNSRTPMTNFPSEITRLQNMSQQQESYPDSCDPPMPPIDLEQLYNLSTDDFTMPTLDNSGPPMPPIDLEQLYNLGTDDFTMPTLENSGPPMPPIDLEQLHNLGTDDFTMPTLDNSGPPMPPIDLEQLYNLGTDDFTMPTLENSGPPMPTIDRSAYTCVLDGNTKIFHSLPNHSQFSYTPISRRESTSQHAIDKHQSPMVSYTAHQNASYSPSSVISVM